MGDTAEIHLTLTTIWEYLRPRIIDTDIGPYPHENIVIGAGVSKRKPGAPVDIARFDALVACEAWKAFTQGNRNALHNPRFGRVLETLGYAIGLRSGLPLVQATQFGAWLAHKVTGWSERDATAQDLLKLDRIAGQATFRQAVQAVLTALRGNVELCPSADSFEA